MVDVNGEIDPLCSQVCICANWSEDLGSTVCIDFGTPQLRIGNNLGIPVEIVVLAKVHLLNR